jgi:hypothetical protein
VIGGRTFPWSDISRYFILIIVIGGRTFPWSVISVVGHFRGRTFPDILFLS